MAVDAEISSLNVAVKANGDAAVTTLEKLADKMDKLADEMDSVTSKSKGLANMGQGLFGKKIQEITDKYREAEKYYKVAQASRERTKALWEHVSALRSQSQADEEETNRLERQAQQMRENAAAWAAFNQTLGRVAGTIASLAARMYLLPITASVAMLKRIPGILKSATSAAVKFGKALAHPVAAIKQLLGLDKKTGGGILGGLLGNKSLAKYVGLIALRRAVTGAIRAIVSGIKEGFENIRQYSSAINSEMYSIQNSLLYVKNAWAAAFAPIISVVKPYVNALLDIIASALNAIGRLVAILTGKGFTVQAVKLSDALYEAGQAGNAAAGGAKNASKAAEEYKKTIMGFDQLNVLNAPNDGGGSGGGGGGGGGSNNGLNVQDMFEETDLSGRLKAAIDAGKWEEVGAYFAEHINAFFAKVDEAVKWDNVGDKVTGVITAITGVINGLVDNINWELLGTTAADALTTFTKAYNLFFDGIEFGDIGEGAADAVNSFVDKVPWEEVGEALVQKFNALWKVGGSFLSGLDFGSIGSAIGDALTGGIKKIDLETVGTAISTAINGITVTISLANMTADTDSLKKKIAGFITNAVGGINAEAISGAMQSLARNVGDVLGTALDSFFKSGGTTKIATIIGGAIGAVSVAIKDFDLSIDWDEAEEDIKTAITTLLNKISNSNFITNAGTVLGHIVEAICGATSDPATLVALEKFGRSVGEALAKVDWLYYLKLVASAIVDALGALIDGLFDGMLEARLKNSGYSESESQEITQHVNESRHEGGVDPGGQNYQSFDEWWSGIVSHFQQNGDHYASSLAPFGNMFLEKLGFTFGRGEQSASDYSGGVKTGADIEKPGLAKKAEELAKAITDGGGNMEDKGIEKGKAYGAGNDKGIRAWLKKLEFAGADAAKSINDGMGIMGDSGLKKGKAFGEGNDKGIRAWLKKLGFAGGDAAKAVNDGMGYMGDQGKTKGKAFGGGVADGVAAELDAAKKKARELGQATANSYNNGIKDIGLLKVSVKLNYTNINGKNYPTELDYKTNYDKAFASGGFPDIGDVFLAREAGPELVGRMGHRNVVANNDQIISGIEAGVARGMAAALSVAGGGGNTMPYEINVTVKTQNDEVLARCVERGQAKRKYRLGMAMG